jgi:uncharacterized protein (TIGR02145 family)
MLVKFERPPMICVNDREKLVRLRLALALSIALGSFGVCWTILSADDQGASGFSHPSRQMADGKEWTTENLSGKTDGSFCYDDVELNCRRYGRLYTWEAAKRGCQLLGDGWRLPTDDDWRQLARRHGGVIDDATNGGTTAYKALLLGGGSGFNALLGGSRMGDGHYERLEAHGFYWTASESNAASAWFYNFGKGAGALNRHRDGEKQMATSVRCVRD